jgi:ABC-type transport system substrate-binding protein
MREEGLRAGALRRRLSRRRVVQGSLAIGGLGLAGCVPGNELPTRAPAAPTTAAAPAATAAAALAKPKYGGVLRSTIFGGVVNGDPHLGLSPVHYLDPILAYSGLMKFKHGKDIKPGGTYIPTGDLAESWDQPDDLTYVFKLRRGAKFQNLKPVNGREATSADVLYSYQRAIDLKFLAYLLSSIQKMETPDPYTFKVTLSEPNADFLANLSLNALAIVAKEAVEVNGDLKSGPNVGTGPWIVDSVDYTKGTCSFLRNPDYFIQGVPYVDRLENRGVPDASTVVAGFRGKELDVIANGLGPQDTEPIRKANPTEVVVTDTVLYGPADEWDFKSDAPPFNDPRVRKAVSLAINREELISGANAGFGALTSGVVVPDLSWMLPPETLKQLYQRDVATAKRLLAEAGQPNLAFEVIAPTYKGRVYVTMAEQIQAQLKDAGISMTIKALDPANFTGLVSQQGQFAAYIASAGNRPITNADLLGRYHSKGAVARIQTHYNNPKLDDLIDQQKVLSRDPAKRRALLEQIQRTVIEDNIIMGLSAAGQQILRWSYVKDFYVNGVASDSPNAFIEAWLDK